MFASYLQPPWISRRPSILIIRPARLSLAPPHRFAQVTAAELSPPIKIGAPLESGRSPTSLCTTHARVLLFLLLVGRTTRHRAIRHLEALMLTHRSRAIRFERLSFGYYCSAAAKSRLACTELLSGPGLPTERVHARSDLTLPCYCSAAAKNPSACTELLFGPGLPTERVHTRFDELNLPRYSSAAVNSRFACTEQLSGPGLPTDRAHARFELELPCYCSSAAAKSRFPAQFCCLALGFQPNGCMPDLG